MEEEKKKKIFPPYLRVVRDDEPLSSQHPINQPKKGEVRKVIYRVVLVASALGTVLGFLGYTGKLEREARPEKVYATGDLNGDGINDLVTVQKNGYKIPLYCLQNKADCVSAEMMRDYYGDKANFVSIEDRLNED